MEAVKYDIVHTSNLKIDGLNWYAYVGNIPLKWIDPMGLEREDDDERRRQQEEERRRQEEKERRKKTQDEIRATQERLNQLERGMEGDPSSPENQQEIQALSRERDQMKGEFNRSLLEHGSATIDDYLSGSTLTSDFEAEQDIGDYETKGHSGIDLWLPEGGDAEMTTPFYTEFDGFFVGDSNAFSLKIIGTDRFFVVLHSDVEDVGLAFGPKDPGDAVVKYPERNNPKPEAPGTGTSSGAHLHIEMHDGTSFYDPLTFQRASQVYLRTFNGGATWRETVPLLPRY